MLRVIRIPLKIVLVPFLLIFSFALFLFEHIFGLIAGVGMILSIVFGVFGIYCVCDPVYRWSAAPALISAFLISPFGIPLIGGVLLVGAENFRDWLKKI